MKRLNDTESEKIKNEFFSKLSETVKGKYPTFWYPLQEINEDIDVLCFDARFLDDKKKLDTIRHIFKKHGVGTVCVVPELDNVYYSDSFLDDIVATDGDGYEFPYFSEQYTFDDTREWMIYKSHEFTVTFAGEWLVRELKMSIDDYEKGVVI